MPTCGDRAYPFANVPDKLKETGSDTSKPSYVAFQKSAADTDNAVYYARVCSPEGYIGLLNKVGHGGVESFKTKSCVSVADMRCYHTDCFCMSTQMSDACDPSTNASLWQTECKSDMQRLTLPDGVGARIYGGWKCANKPLQTAQNFGGGTTTYRVGGDADSHQSIEFFLVPGYECNAAGHVVLTDPKARAAAKAKAARRGKRKAVVLIGGGVLVLLLLALALAPKRTPLATKDLTNQQILALTGLAAKGAPTGAAVKGSVRDVVQGGRVALEKGAGG